MADTSQQTTGTQGAAPHLLVEREGPVVVVTMNRPERKNAFSSEMLVRMAEAWRMIDVEEDVRVAILTGAGGTFCAGADLKAMAGGHQRDEWSKRFDEDADLQWKGLLRHYRLKKPLIAAVEGYAVAGGTEILQATDIRVAGASATFGVAEVRRGLFPVGGSTVRLRRQIPYTHAAEILLTGRMVPAEEALRIGLIGRVVPDGQALAEARKIAEQIAENGPLAVQAVLRSLRETEGMTELDALQHELKIGIPVFATEDAREGPRAFAEKRKPQFKGR
ncbi:MAG TPA: crotonase/enoyl-CoA hydratase family protein [Myxococcota bacterium]|nr:crotonase/enoyl-CoA hydratase family protein [Myxococcota bacterium]